MVENIGYCQRHCAGTAGCCDNIVPQFHLIAANPIINPLAEVVVAVKTLGIFCLFHRRNTVVCIKNRFKGIKFALLIVQRADCGIYNIVLAVNFYRFGGFGGNRGGYGDRGGNRGGFGGNRGGDRGGRGGDRGGRNGGGFRGNRF